MWQWWISIISFMNRGGRNSSTTTTPNNGEEAPPNTTPNNGEEAPPNTTPNNGEEAPPNTAHNNRGQASQANQTGSEPEDIVDLRDLGQNDNGVLVHRHLHAIEMGLPSAVAGIDTIYYALAREVCVALNTFKRTLDAAERKKYNLFTDFFDKAEDYERSNTVPVTIVFGIYVETEYKKALILSEKKYPNNEAHNNVIRSLRNLRTYLGRVNNGLKTPLKYREIMTRLKDHSKNRYDTAKEAWKQSWWNILSIYSLFFALFLPLTEENRDDEWFQYFFSRFEQTRDAGDLDEYEREYQKAKIANESQRKYCLFARYKTLIFYHQLIMAVPLFVMYHLKIKGNGLWALLYLIPLTYSMVELVFYRYQSNRRMIKENIWFLEICIFFVLLLTGLHCTIQGIWYFDFVKDAFYVVWRYKPPPDKPTGNSTVIFENSGGKPLFSTWSMGSFLICLSLFIFGAL